MTTLAEIKDGITRAIEAYAQKEDVAPSLWGPALVGVADVEHSVIKDLKGLVSPTHYDPQALLPGATAIISYFLPFNREVAMENVGGDTPTASWSGIYTLTNRMFLDINAELTREIEGWGCRAVTPGNIGTIGPERIYSNWSQRHIAYAAGLGTFGLNNMLITERGCCGRCFSLITDLPIQGESGPVQEAGLHEACLHKRGLGCEACVRRCPAGALSADRPFDRAACYARLRDNERYCGEKVCGKCVVGLPCTFRVP